MTEAESQSREEESYLIARDLSGAEREAFLDADCARDPKRKARIEARLAEEEGERVNSGRLGDEVTESLRRMARASLGPLGRYEIIEQIGEGEMGRVYRARQHNPQRMVALKILRSPIPTQAEVLRFEREFQILGRMHHPGIAQVYDAGTENVGFGEQPFFAMELIEGSSLPEFLATHEMSLPEKLRFFLEICDAVRHAHDRGIIHRDLTPKNILVTSEGRAKIIDFGVARALGRDVGFDVRTTQTGQALGTTQYMSPEQARGDTENVGVRSDVYALGLILHEVLVGTPPYEIRDETSQEAIRIICEEPPPRPGLAHGELRGDLEAIIIKALEKDPEHRYSSAGELANDVGRYLRDEPILARPPGCWIRISKWSRRNPTRALASGLLVAVLIAFSVFGAYRAMGIWSMSRVARAAWSEGDLAETRRSLEGIPARADAWLLPDSLSSVSAPMRELSGELPEVLVLTHLEEMGPRSAWLLAARFLERDGPAAHPVLAEFLVRALETPPGDRSPRRRDALEVVGRLFFDRPLQSVLDNESTARLRERLHEIAATELSHFERLHLFTALSGCGTAESLEPLLAVMERSEEREHLTERTEEVRLGMRAVERIVMRLHHRGDLELLAEGGDERALRRCIRLVEAFGPDPPFPLRGVLGEYCCTTAFARRAADLPPLDLHPVLDERCAQRLRAGRGDPQFRRELLREPESFLDPGGDPERLRLSLERFAQGVGLVEPLGSAGEQEERALRAAIGHGLSASIALDAVTRGRTSAQLMRAGLRPDFEPDEDTHLGAYFEKISLPIEEGSDRVRDQGEQGVIARWDFTGEDPEITGAGTTAFWRDLRVAPEENAPHELYLRLGTPETSLLGLRFEGAVAHRHYVTIRVTAVKALRRLLPYHGECYVTLRIDGEHLGTYRLESTDPDASHESIMLWERFGSGPHTLTLELTPESNTTVRICSVEIRD